MISKLGGNPTTIEKEMNETLQYISQLYKVFRSNDEETYTKYMTLKELSNATGINWIPFVKGLIDSTDINITENEPVYTPSTQWYINYIRQILKAPKRVQANYFFFEIVLWIKKYLPGLYNIPQNNKPSSHGCINDVMDSLPLLINSLYAKKYFDVETKKQIQDIVFRIRNEFMKVLKTVKWLDNYTRSNAIEKLSSMKACVGYPEELINETFIEEYYKKLQINITSYLSSIMSIRAFQFDQKFNQLREPVEHCYWFGDSLLMHIVNAFYDPETNGIKLPAAIFQGPTFSKYRPNYVNYAAAGLIIGHEVTHGFDTTGRLYDKDGSYAQWWTNETSKTFTEKAKCIIHQYNQFIVPELNKSINGSLTVGENIADNGGLKHAYLAYNTWIKENGPEKMLPGLNYTDKQLFWIAFAQFWCTYNRISYLQKSILDVHSPARFRVLGSLKNSESFATDFNCPLGTPMNPKKNANYGNHYKILIDK